ncbi:ABC-three component system protein [Aliivibrio sifiae]|uniref:ABC-three component systems C-terminal domain-containing protein n=1 Tax=Aliivibrio sifiae TaxID=566293 RepID=A0A2S7XDB0_9GAMM|nr:ABC-three component system protein [Aliivibrio sifiae]PQJ89363.1 hypothetical protein BTO22_07080 [Aliivibrio sifiae]
MLGNTLEKAKQATVCVLDGSGVLINPYTSQYSYILTAKHVVEDTNVEHITVVNIEGQSLTVIDKLEHLQIDAAILKIERVENIETSYIVGFDNQQQSIKLFGYPSNRRELERAREQLYSYDGILHDIQTNSLVYSISDIIQYEDIEGFSGGGIFLVDDEKEEIFLTAIEFEIFNAQSIDSKINCIKMDEYIELLRNNSWAEIKPNHLSDFIFHSDYIFNNLDLENENSLNVIKNIITNILIHYGVISSEQINPDKIIARFKSRILAYGQDLQNLYDKELWCGFLEFLSIYLSLFSPNNINSVNVNYLDQMFLRFRFIYDHDNSKFRQLFKKLILETELGPLNSDGKILIFTRDNSNTGSPYVSKRVSEQTLTDIGSALTGDRIERVRKNKEISNDILFWPSISDVCLSENEDELSRINILQTTEFKEKIVEIYGEYLSDD